MGDNSVPICRARALAAPVPAPYPQYPAADNYVSTPWPMSPAAREAQANAGLAQTRHQDRVPGGDVMDNDTAWESRATLSRRS